MLKNVVVISRSSRQQPPWNAPGAVVAALRALASADSEKAGSVAYDRVLYAVGNNHRGTYCPIVLDVIPFLGEIVARGAPIARARALDILIDLIGFEPDSELMGGSGEQLDSLRAKLESSVRRLTPAVQAILGLPHASEAQDLARELLRCLDDAEG